MQEIKEREIFYLSGYDPRGYRYYYSLYKKNVKKHNKIDDINIKLSKTKKVKSHIYSCELNTKNKTKIDYNFLVWNDIVKDNWSESFFANVLDSIYFIKMYLLSGIFVRFTKESPAQLIAGLYPLFYLIISFLILFALSFNSYSLVTKLSSNIFGILVFILLFFTGSKIIEKIGNKFAVFWLSRIYAFCARWSENKIEKIDERIEYFSEHIINKLQETNNKNKEYILSAHSVGTLLAIGIATRVIKKCKEKNIDYSNFKLLTLGHCIPLVSFQRKAFSNKKDLEYLGTIKDFTWLDYTATIDGACFAFVDPISASGIKKEKNCGAKIQSTRFFKLYKKENYQRVKKQKYTAHFLYLMATDLLGNYNYFDITAGTKPLEYRIETYMKEK